MKKLKSSTGQVSLDKMKNREAKESKTLVLGSTWQGEDAEASTFLAHRNSQGLGSWASKPPAESLSPAQQENVARHGPLRGILKQSYSSASTSGELNPCQRRVT